MSDEEDLSFSMRQLRELVEKARKDVDKLTTRLAGIEELFADLEERVKAMLAARSAGDSVVKAITEQLKPPEV